MTLCNERDGSKDHPDLMTREEARLLVSKERWDDDEAAQERVVTALTKKGLTCREIGVEMGLPKWRVQHIRTRLGLRVAKRFQLDDAVADKIKQLTHQGHTEAQIAEQTGLKRWEVQRARKELGLVRDRSAETAMREQRVRELSEAGLTAAEIGEQEGIATSTVWQMRSRIGVRMRDMRKPTNARVQRIIDEVEVFQESVGEGMRRRDRLVRTMDPDDRRAVAKAMRELRTELSKTISMLESKDGQDD